MAEVTVETYTGGELVDSRVGDVPESADDRARVAFRDAVSKATSLEALKDAILGTTTGAEPDVRPSR